MLHELLLALLGYTGDFVIDEREQSKTLGISDPQIASDEPSFTLAVDLSFIQPSERSAIERLISLGFYYRELNRFATVSRNLTSVQTTKDSPTQRTSDFIGKSGKSSIYRRAIANGIVEILSVYKTAVLQVEQNLLSDPVPILSTVTQGLNKEFNKKSNSLYTILRSSRLAGSQRAPFLRQFLMRLNFNSFFEATALNVVRPRPTLPSLQQ